MQKSPAKVLTPLRQAVEKLFIKPQRNVSGLDDGVTCRKKVIVPDGETGNLEVVLSFTNGERGDNPTTIGIQIPNTDPGNRFKSELFVFLTDMQVTLQPNGHVGGLSISEQDFNAISDFLQKGVALSA